MGKAFDFSRSHAGKAARAASSLAAALAVAVLLAVTGCAGSGGAGVPGTAIASSGPARLYKAGPFKVAVLQGDYYEMGRQYGTLLREDITAMYYRMAKVAESESASLKLGKSLAEIQSFCLSQCELYPRRLREITRGLSRASGLKPEQLALIDTIVLWQMESYYQSDGDACSSIAVWGPYTGGGPLMLGRDFDFPLSYMDLNRYLSVIVFNPDDGSEPVAALSYAGQTGCVQFFNAKGLAAEFNDGSEVTAPNDKIITDRIPFTASLMQFGLDCSSLAQLDAAFRTTRFNYPILCNVVDAKEGCTFEAGTTDVIRRGDVAEGLQVIANTPIDPRWNMPPPGHEDPRRDNLVALAGRYKGRIDLATMKKIMDTPVEEGGSKVPPWKKPGEEAVPAPSIEDYRSYTTLYQFIYKPETLDLYLKAVDLSGWVRVGLKPLFMPQEG